MGSPIGSPCRSKLVLFSCACAVERSRPGTPTSDAWLQRRARLHPRKFECTGTRLDVTAADARGAGAFSTLLLVGSMLLIAGFIVARKAARTAESEPLLATTA